MTYTVVVLMEGDGRYSVTVPALEGCATWGESLPDALRMAEEAIRAYIDGLLALGRLVPSDMPDVEYEPGDAVEESVHQVTVR